MGTRRKIDSFADWDSENEILSVLGPTASGKTNLLLAFLERRSWKIRPLLISLDSVAVYRYLDIGSAKPLGRDRENWEWAGIDIALPDEKLSAADFLNKIEAQYLGAIQSSRPIVFVGGSHFYERFLVEGPAPGEASDPEFLKETEEGGLEKAYAKLCESDSRWSEKIHVNDSYRVLRYSDLVFRQGLNYQELFFSNNNESRSVTRSKTVSTLVLDYPDPIQKDEILKKRIEKMWEAGWVYEHKNVTRMGYARDCPGLQCVGYKEISHYLDGNVTEMECLDLILTRHRQLAKSQRTWLRSLKEKLR